MFIAWIFISAINVHAQEYFQDDFDPSKNCKHLDLIIKLKKEPGRCSQRSKGKVNMTNILKNFHPYYSCSC